MESQSRAGDDASFVLQEHKVGEQDDDDENETGGNEHASHEIILAKHPYTVVNPLVPSYSRLHIHYFHTYTIMYEYIMIRVTENSK